MAAHGLSRTERSDEPVQVEGAPKLVVPLSVSSLPPDSRQRAGLHHHCVDLRRRGAADSAGVSEAIVTVTNTATGARWQTCEPAGTGPLFLRVSLRRRPSTRSRSRAIGFEPSSRTGINLSLGDRRRVDFTLTAAVELA